MVDTPIRVCLVSPGLLPVPATQGGAIETLMTTLMRQNERLHRMDLTVISSDEPKARALAEEYRSTHVVFLQSPGLLYKVANRVRNLWNRKRRSRVLCEGVGGDQESRSVRCGGHRGRSV